MAKPSLDRLIGIDEACAAADSLKCGFVMLGWGEFSLVDFEDLPNLNRHSWRKHTGGYAWRRGTFRGKQIYMHQQILNPPDGFETDHINRNKLDNRRCNLRIATRQQNRANTPVRSHNRASRFKGVRKNYRKYNARGILNGREYSLGSFDSEIEAAKAYNNWAKKHFGEFAYLNPV